MNGQGYRGYIASRPMPSGRAPQHLQNLMVREHARRNNLKFLLSATEYAMPDCFMILEQVLDDLEKVDGIIAYSLFLLPPDANKRRVIWQRFLELNKTLHFALEGLIVSNSSDVERIEDIWLVKNIMAE